MKKAVFDETEFTLDELKFDLDELKFDLDETKFRLDEDLIEHRWKHTEKALRKAFPLIRKNYEEIADEIVELMDVLKVDQDKLRNKVPEHIRRKVERKLKEWSEKKILSGYLRYLSMTNRWTYSDVLTLLLHGIYAEHAQKTERIANDVFKVTAVSGYGQAIQELPEDKKQQFRFKPLKLSEIMAMIAVPVLGRTFSEYLGVVNTEQAEDIRNFVLTVYVGNERVADEQLRTRIIKQGNRILLVREDKFSGGLEDTARVVMNNAYTEHFKDIPKLQVRFVAVMDDRTTKMCQSLHNQLFYLNDMNRFERYSDIDKKYVVYEIFGLLRGLNLPPIENHYHNCRSTITYQPL